MDKKKSEIKKLQDGCNTAFIDGTYNSNLAYRPEFITNDYKKGKKVLFSIEQGLLNCDEFCISVAFITKSGITPLLQTLDELEKRNVPGKILTTDYLMFSEPYALEKLASLKNIELKMFCTDAGAGGFHTKGYIFRKEEIYRIIVGSANMTLSAITQNREWNTKIVSTTDGEFAQCLLEEFNELWKDSHSKGFNDFYENYKTKYEIIKEQRKIANKKQVVGFEQYKLVC